MAAGHDFALAPQTLAEFVHVVTDGKRMPQPPTMVEAVSRAEHWWQTREVARVFPDSAGVSDFLSWLMRYRPGRKRLLDTMLAATFLRAGVRRVISNNESHFQVFPGLEVVAFRA